MSFYKTLILGSSYFGTGFAILQDNCFITERSQLADPGFFGTLSGFQVTFSDNWENETKELYAFFESMGCIRGNNLNLLASEILLCSFMRQKSIEPLFGTDIIDIKKSDDRYNITLLNNGGHELISAKKIIDTRPRDEKKCLNILCKGTLEKNDFEESPDFQIDLSDAFEDDEKILTFRFSEATDVNAAKMKAIRYLYKNFDGKNKKIVESAYLMHGDLALQPFVNGEIPLVRDISFDSPFDAFNAGVKYAKEVKKQ